MAKKGLLVLILMILIAGSVFAQYGSGIPKHEPFDMLLGLNVGGGFTWWELPNLFGGLKKGNYGGYFSLGATFDFYLFNWLSFTSGMLYQPNMFILLDYDFGDSLFDALDDEDFDFDTLVDDLGDAAFLPAVLTIPLMVHVNIPAVDFLYVGAGININIPLIDKFYANDTKRGVFIGFPIDFGFDFMKPDRGGPRFFMRVTPEFHGGFGNTSKMTVPIGLVWQITNFKF